MAEYALHCQNKCTVVCRAPLQSGHVHASSSMIFAFITLSLARIHPAMIDLRTCLILSLDEYGIAADFEVKLASVASLSM